MEKLIGILKGIIYSLVGILVIIIIAILISKKAKSPLGEAGAAELKIGIMETQRTNSLNPYLVNNQLANYLSELVYDGLWNWEYDEETQKLGLKNALSEDKKPTRITAEDPKENAYEISLKRGIKWHNGKDFTANDVNFSFNYIINNNIARYFPLKKLLKKIEVVNDSKIRLTFRKIQRNGLSSDVPLSLISELLSCKILPAPEPTTTPEGDWMNKLKTEPLGTGPYQLTRSDQSIELLKNDLYYGFHNDNLPEGAVPIHKVVFNFFPVLKDAVETLENSLYGGNEIDMLLDVSPKAFDRLNNRFEFKKYYTPYFYLLAFNGNSPKFASKDVRQAVIGLLPREKLARTVWESQDLGPYINYGPFNASFLESELEMNPTKVDQFKIPNITEEEAEKRLEAAKVDRLNFIILSEVDDRDELNNDISNNIKSSLNDFKFNKVSLEVENTSLSSSFIEKVYYETDFDAVLLKVEMYELEDYLTKDCQSGRRSDPICNISGFSRIEGGWEDLFYSFREASSLNKKQELALQIHKDITDQYLWDFLFTIPKRTYFTNKLQINGEIHPKYFFSTIENWYFQPAAENKEESRSK
jgi:ABC-type transport system substrate-binding protein